MLRIDHTAYLIMLAHCQAHYPLEACGFLAGRAGLLTAVYLIDNTLASPVRFEMDAAQQLGAMLHRDELGLSDMVIFHSHPHGPSRPSATDRRLAFYPDWPQAIISLRTRYDPLLRIFTVTAEAVQEIPWMVE